MSRTSIASSSRRETAPPADVPSVPGRPEEVRRTLQALGVVPSKRAGQSFLVDPFVADAEAALVGVPPGRPVLEVGGGLGLLTAALLRRGLGPLTVVEKDPRLAGFLRTTFGGRIQVRTVDALKVDLSRTDCLIGNLPYSVGTAILTRAFAARVPRAVFLVQREVAERVAAGPGSKAYGRLSIFARCYGSVELFRTVGPDAFFPPPRVESRLAVHVARPGPLPVGSVATLERAVNRLFSSRRKQLGNLLPRLGVGEPEELAEAAGWPEDWARRRPEELPPEAYFALSDALDARSSAS